MDELFEAAKKAMANSHSPYSKFPVGAAIRGIKGNVFAGCNIENASYPEGWCAETSAISQMVTSGETTIADIVVMAEKMDRITPCGGCRQRISEFANANTRIHLCDSGGIVETLTIDQLLPSAFKSDKNSLEQK